MDSAKKVISILEVFLKQKDKVGISDLAKLSGLSLSTAHRFATTLAKEGYLKQEFKRGKYSLGIKFLEFGRIILSRLELNNIARPFLEEIGEQSGETVVLAVFDGTDVINIMRVESRHVLQVHSAIGRIAPLHATAVGKILLAFMPEEEFTKYLGNKELISRTNKTITNINVLKKELETVRREEIGIDDEENNPGVWSIAAPVRDWTGKVVAAVGIIGPVSRQSLRETEKLKELIKRIGDQISRDMGFKDLK